MFGAHNLLSCLPSSAALNKDIYINLKARHFAKDELISGSSKLPLIATAKPKDAGSSAPARSTANHLGPTDKPRLHAVTMTIVVLEKLR